MTVESGSEKRPNFKQLAMKRTDREEELMEDTFDTLDTKTCMSEMLTALQNQSFFNFFPLVLHICSTIDSTQGLTINSPILALLKPSDRAEDIIVVLSRSSNPDMLLVANKIFDQRYEQIDSNTKGFVRMNNKLQRLDGYL